MQRRAGQVQSDIGLALAQVRHDADVRRLLVDVRAHMAALGEAINDGILDLQRAVLGVANGRVGTGKVHGDGGSAGEVLFPGNGVGTEIEIQIVVHLEFGEHQHDAGGKTAPQTGLVANGQFAFEMDTGHGLTDLLRAQGGQLDGQQVFQPLGAGCKKFFHHAHGDAIKIVPHYTLSARTRHPNLGVRANIKGLAGAIPSVLALVASTKARARGCNAISSAEGHAPNGDELTQGRCRNGMGETSDK